MYQHELLNPITVSGSLASGMMGIETIAIPFHVLSDTILPGSLYVTVIVSEAVWLVAELVAVTVMTLAPVVRAILAALQEVVPVQVPLPPLSFAHVTLVHPVEAVPDTVTVELVVEYVA